MTKYTVCIYYLMDGVGTRTFTYTVHAKTQDMAIEAAKTWAFADGGRVDGRISVRYVRKS